MKYPQKILKDFLEIFHNFLRIINKIISKYKIKNTLQNLPFYSEKTNNTKQNNKKFTNGKILSELPLFPKNTKKLSNYQLSKELQFFPKRPKKLKKTPNTKKYTTIF